MKKLDVATLATVAGGTLICKPVCAPACPPAPCAPAPSSCGTKSKKC
ncbi:MULTISPECIES: hypothetical protein [Methylobacterium]|nr:hypothetical protein [Methylobacterium sp. DB0501]NGM34332.1 hypothetical protein [Methylobacterium sp. DB0501]NGM34333.1 hypothetical protein [Methylobacterium sp. DB0501]